VPKILSWMITLPLALGIIVFSIANRDSVEVNTWPLPFVAEIPLYILVLVALVAGVVWGGFSAWMAAGVLRRRSRENLRRAELAEQEAKHLKVRLSQIEKAESERNRSTLPVSVDAA